MLALVLGLAAVGYAAYLALNSEGRLSSGALGQPAPRQLENVREAAGKIEADALERAAQAGRAPEGG